jgi:hypothetical protein
MEINANEYKNTSKTINATKVQENKTLQVPLVIVDVTEIKLNDRKKIALTFGGVQDVLILNQTNLDVMIIAKGANAYKWITSTITLSVIPSKYNGQPVNSVYISKVV